jgi:hypothetical protein
MQHEPRDFDPGRLPPIQAAYLREVQATDPAAVPRVVVRLLAKNGLYRYLTARDRTRSPQESENIAQTVAVRPRVWSQANFDDFIYPRMCKRRGYEADTFLKDHDELRGILNTGQRRGGAVLRCVGDQHETRWASCRIASPTTGAPLSAIAAVAGGVWPERIRAIAAAAVAAGPTSQSGWSC